LPRVGVGVSQPVALNRLTSGLHRLAVARVQYRAVLVAVGERGAQLDADRRCSRFDSADVARHRPAGFRGDRFDELAPSGPVPCWLSLTDWLTQVWLWLHTEDGRTACRAEPIAVDTAWRVAVAYALAADTDTGRNCWPGIEAVEADAQVSRAVVHRGKRVLAAGRFMVRAVRGQRLPLLDRLAVWRIGSKTHGIRSVYTLTMPRRRVASVDSETPPPMRCTSRARARLRNTQFSKTARHKAGEAAPRPPGQAGAGRVRPDRGSRPRRRPRMDPRTLDLVSQLRSRVPWLATASVRRLGPAVHRFAIDAWSAAELVAAIDRQLTLRERTVPARLRQPEAYLAWLIGPIEPVDPTAGGGAAAAAHQRAEQRHQAAERARYTGPAAVRGERRRQTYAAAGAAAARAALDRAVAERLTAGIDGADRGERLRAAARARARAERRQA
jgi:hypothetical protein